MTHVSGTASILIVGGGWFRVDAKKERVEKVMRHDNAFGCYDN